MEGGRAQRRHADQAIHRRVGGGAVARLAHAARSARPRAAPFPARRLGALRRAQRRVLWPAPAGRRDRAGAWRRARRRLPAGAGAVRNRMKAVPHPLAPAARLVTTRDLLFLCGSLVLVILPHALRAPWWITLLALCLYGWRIHYSLNPAPLPARWLVLSVAAVAMLGVWFEYRTLFGRQPGIVLLM